MKTRMKRGLSLDDLSATATSNANGTNVDKDSILGGDGSFTQVTGKRKKLKKQQLSANSQSNPLDNAASASTLVPELISRIGQLEDRVEQQSQIIVHLTDRIQFLFSMFDINTDIITDLKMSQNVQSGGESRTVTGSLQSSNSGSKHPSVDQSSQSGQSNTLIIVGQQSSDSGVVQPPTYSDAVRKAAVFTARSSVRQNLLTAVHVDLQHKKSRQNSVVVSGLPPCSDTTDKNLVDGLFIGELGLQVHIMSCRRFGRNTEHKPQPILVSLSSVSEADTVISMAKKLRHSSDSHVRSHIFINAYLTQAEARAAFELRQRRRQSAAIRQSSQADYRQIQNQPAQLFPGQDGHAGSDQQSSAVLNASAVSFIPSSSSLSSAATSSSPSAAVVDPSLSM